MDKVKNTLEKLFEKDRIVFWYDVKQELRSEYESLILNDIEKIELNNNEFSVKYKMLKEFPEQKFLLYLEGQQPKDINNWLLDVELAHGEFRSDQESMWLGELGLGFEYSDLVREHNSFFINSKLRDGLQSLLDIEDSYNSIRMKMLATCANSGIHINSIVTELFSDLSSGSTHIIDAIENSKLDGFLWKALENSFNYKSSSPNIKDFSVELLKSSYLEGVIGQSTLNTDAVVFLRQWKDSMRKHQDFEEISKVCADDLGIEDDLRSRNYKNLIGIDYFELIDREIIRGLIRDLGLKSISPAECVSLVNKRRETHWYKKYAHVYGAIYHAAHFFRLIDEADLTMIGLEDGVRKYSENWYKIDLNYRKYIYHTRESGQSSLLESLTGQVEDFNSNKYLLKLNDGWQQYVDSCEQWEISPIVSQSKFFQKYIAPGLAKTKVKKTFVIISDALRYENGMELLNRIQQEDRYTGIIEPMLASLPSYTQLGMASLLPHEKLSFSEDNVGLIISGENSTQGTVSRSKVLEKEIPGRATAMKLDEFVHSNNDQRKAMIKDHDVIYFYHNEIDKTGDDLTSEDRVFNAVENTFDYLIKAVKKLYAANANRVLITSDHGYIYQNKTLAESDYIEDSSVKGEVLFHNRRFLLGKNFDEHSSFKRFKSEDVGLIGDMEMMIPKSINRLRKRGSGSRFVHGGASLQEVVIPMLEIKKKKVSDLTFVGVEIIKGSSSIISSGQISVSFYQNTPVTNKERPINLRAGIYCKDELISESHELVFDMTSSDPRDREKKLQFILTQDANKHNNKDVELRLYTKIKDTERDGKVYASVTYTLRRSFTSDFDF
jgi:uncharacterized protein (TIGR02687 family)